MSLIFYLYCLDFSVLYNHFVLEICCISGVINKMNWIDASHLMKFNYKNFKKSRF